MNHRLRAVVSISFFWTGMAIAQVPHTITLYVVPNHPNPGDEIVAVLFFPVGGCVDAGTFNLTQNHNDLTISHVLPSPAIADAGTCVETYPIGRLPVGRYNLEWDVVQLNGTFRFFTNFIVDDGGLPNPVPAVHGFAIVLLIAALVFLTMICFRHKFRHSPFPDVRRYLRRTEALRENEYSVVLSPGHSQCNYCENFPDGDDDVKEEMRRTDTDHKLFEDQAFPCSLSRDLSC